MNELINFIENELDIPYIEENQAVMDGSFMVSPYYMDGLMGDGKIQVSTLYYSTDIFYREKEELIQNSKKLYKALCNLSKYVSEFPDFTYENEAHLWRCTLRIQEVQNE